MKHISINECVGGAFRKLTAQTLISSKSALLVGQI
jgi:hypothetical protein